MTDLSEHEEILKEYDSALMKRLLGYVKPYLLVSLLSIGALLLATGAELVIPILIQRAVDNHILPYHRGLRIESAPLKILEKLGPLDPDFIVDGLYYFPTSKLANLSSVEKKELSDNGTLSGENFIVIQDYTLKPGAKSIVNQHPGLFHANQHLAVITETDLKSLDSNDLKIIRKEHYHRPTTDRC